MKTKDLWWCDLDAKWTPERQTGRYGLQADSTRSPALGYALPGSTSCGVEAAYHKLMARCNYFLLFFAVLGRFLVDEGMA